MNKKVLLALSGGIDSASLLAYMLDASYEVECVFFDYGSKHNKLEQMSSIKLASYFTVPLDIVDMTNTISMFTSDLLNTGGPIPEGHYEDTNMRHTVVPARNMIFISILAGLAASREFSQIAIGIHKGDRVIYPDCRKEFADSMSMSVNLATDNKIFLLYPFIDMTKSDIILHGLSGAKSVPYYLTRTCYTDKDIACGKCGSCVERLEAFHLQGMIDPITYAVGG